MNDQSHPKSGQPTQDWLRSFVPGRVPQHPLPSQSVSTNPVPVQNHMEYTAPAAEPVPPMASHAAYQHSGYNELAPSPLTNQYSLPPMPFQAQPATLGAIAPVKMSRKQLKAAKAAQKREQKAQHNLSSQTREKADLSFQSMNKYLRLSHVFLIVLVFVVGGWAYFSQIKGAVIASGSIAVEGKPKIVQHLDGGIISEIYVVDGDFVEKGDPVMKLDSTIINAARVAAETAFYENEALISRLLAEKSNQDMIFWSSVLQRNKSNSRVSKAMLGQQQLFEARRNARDGAINQLEQQINKLRADDQGLVSEIDFTRSELNIVKPELDKFKRLLQQGLAPRNRVTQLEIDKTRLENQISKLESQRENIFNSIQEININIKQTLRVRQEDILTELRDAQTQADTYAQDLKTTSAKSGQIEIKAPSSGTVHNTVVTTVGGVITPGQEVMQIIPRRDKLEITAQVLPQDIDQVSLGQETNIIFSALNQKTAPELSGIVSHISANAIVDDPQAMPYYTVNIDIPDSEISKLNGQALIAGMPADVFIQTRSRTVMDYLLEPAKNALSKTMRDG